ncbi:MAG: hypothetical protein J6M12_07810 [Clostridia bacterium]|nr:hypothetical protein [Clostridia bacterium]
MDFQKFWVELFFCVADLIGLNGFFENVFPAKKVLLNFFQKIAGCRGSALTKKTLRIFFTVAFQVSPFARAFLFGSFSLRL